MRIDFFIAIILRNIYNNENVRNKIKKIINFVNVNEFQKDYYAHVNIDMIDVLHFLLILFFF